MNIMSEFTFSKGKLSGKIFGVENLPPLLQKWGEMLGCLVAGLATRGRCPRDVGAAEVRPRVRIEFPLRRPLGETQLCEPWLP